MSLSRILVSGSSGLIGSALLPFLQAKGFTVTRLVRNSAAGNDQDRLGPGPSRPARDRFRLRRGHPSGGRVHRRPLDRGQEATDHREPHPGHRTPGGSRSQSGAAPASLHLSFRRGLLRQPRGRDSARRESFRRWLRRRNLPSVGRRNPARGCGRNSHRADAHRSGDERGRRRLAENDHALPPGPGRQAGQRPAMVELGLSRRRCRRNSSCVDA